MSFSSDYSSLAGLLAPVRFKTKYMDFCCVVEDVSLPCYVIDYNKTKLGKVWPIKDHNILAKILEKLLTLKMLNVERVCLSLVHMKQTHGHIHTYCDR